MEENKNTHKQCNVCGREIGVDWNYCNYCGTILRKKYADSDSNYRLFFLMNDFEYAMNALDVMCDAIQRDIEQLSRREAFAFVSAEVHKRFSEVEEAVYELINENAKGQEEILKMPKMFGFSIKAHRRD